MQNRFRSLAVGAYISLFLALLLFNAFSFWHKAFSQIATPWQLDYGEGIVLFQATKIDDLTFAYKPIDQSHYVVFHYPPIYHIAARVAAAFTGSILSGGRLVSVVSGLLIEIAIGLLVFFCLPRRFSFATRLITGLSAALYMNLLDVMRWTWLARVDMLAILLSYVGAIVFVLSGRRRIWQYVAFALFVAALFTKQTMVAAPMACFIAALIVDYRLALRLAAFATLLGSLVLGIMSWLTAGGFVRNLFFYNQNSFSIVRMIYEPATNIKLIVPIVALAASYGFFVIARTVGLVRQKRWNVLRARLERSLVQRLSFVFSLLLVLAFAVSLTSGKNGSNYNYFIEWNIACIPLATLLVFRVVRPLGVQPSWSPALGLAAILPMVMLAGNLPDAVLRLRPIDPAEEQRKRKESGENYAAVIKLIQEAKGPVYSEDMTMLVKAGKEVVAEPSIIRELSSVGLWDERPFLQMIEQHRFPVIVIQDLGNWKRHSPTVARAIRQAYSITREIGEYKIYEPAGISHEVN
jgi:hypothetical protein